MSNALVQTTESAEPDCSAFGNCLNLLASPGEVYDALLGAPFRLANWLVPTLVVCLSNVILLGVAATPDHAASLLAPLVDNGMLSGVQAEAMAANWEAISAAVTCVAAVAGTVWSATVVWFIGRVFLKTRFSWLKALEMVGLSQMVLVLGATVTFLLILATGDASARPAASLLMLGHAPDGRVRALLEMLNVFHLWSTVLLTVVLGRLSGASFKEAAFWVFGWLVALRAARILLT